jgi:uncharacterized membrane protein YfcA
VGIVELVTLVVGLGVAGLAKGMSGMGLPLIATPILAGAFGPKMAVTIVTIPIFVSNSLLLTQGFRRRGLLTGVARGDRLLGDDPAALRARILGPLVCFVGGVLQGTTSIASPLVGSYFHAQRLAPADFVFVLAAIFELNSVVQFVGYSLQGLYTPEVIAIGLIAVVPTLLALAAGIYLRGKLDPVWFRRLIIALLVLSVANLLWRTFVA